MAKNYDYYSNFFNNATPEQVAELERKLAATKAGAEVATVDALAKDEAQGTVQSWINHYKNTILPTKQAAGEVEEENPLDNPETLDLVQRAADLRDRVEDLLEDGVEITVQVPLKVRVYFNANEQDLLDHTYSGDLTNVSEWLEIDSVEVEGDTDGVDYPLADVIVAAGDVLQDAVDNGSLDDSTLDAVLAEYAPELNDLYQDFKAVAIDFDKSNLESTDQLLELVDEL